MTGELTLAQADAREIPPVPAWHWESEPDTRELVIRFVRGAVEIVRAEGTVEVDVIRRAVRSDPREALIAVTETQQQVVISDSYPATSTAALLECLQPADERGAFWASDVHLHAIVRVPPSVRVRVELMNGGPIAERGEPGESRRSGRKGG